MSEVWSIRKPEYGDQIRVDRGLYHHHGIYAFDNEVYAFQSPEGAEVNPNTAVVLCESLKDFAKGGVVEVREFSEEEKKRKRTPLEIIEHARSELGNQGYHLIRNNCEHFANRCVFGENTSTQVKDVFEFLFKGAF